MTIQIMDTHGIAGRALLARLPAICTRPEWAHLYRRLTLADRIIAVLEAEANSALGLPLTPRRIVMFGALSRQQSIRVVRVFAGIVELYGHLLTVLLNESAASKPTISDGAGRR